MEKVKHSTHIRYNKNKGISISHAIFWFIAFFLIFRIVSPQSWHIFQNRINSVFLLGGVVNSIDNHSLALLRSSPLLDTKNSEESKGVIFSDTTLQKIFSEEHGTLNTNEIRVPNDEIAVLKTAGHMNEKFVRIEPTELSKTFKNINVNDNAIIDKYRNELLNATKDDHVTLPSIDMIYSYLERNHALRRYFCNALTTNKTLKRGNYGDHNVKILQLFYGYVLHVPLEIDSDYGVFMKEVSRKFREVYQGRELDRATWNAEDTEFVRNVLLLCEE